VHVLLARNVDLVNVPRWLNEGLAMHLSGEYRWSTSFAVARMYLQEQIIPLRNLNFAFAAPRSDWEFSNAYAEAHSLTKFLYDKLGDEDFWRLVAALKTEHFEDALPRYSKWTPDSLFDAWERSLWKVALVSSTVSGLTIFQLAALLTVLAYWRRSRRARATLRQWEDEEEFESPWYDPPREVYWEPESDDDHP